MYRAKRSGTGMIELAPEQILALAFCRRRLREPYGLLLRFDRSLGRAMPHLGPPIVGQARLAWWREQIRSSPGSGAPDPVLDGLGGMIGGYYSGIYWEWLGPEPVFILAAFCCSLALLVAYLGVARRPLQELQN